MRLIHTFSYVLHNLSESNLPPFAVLSHAAGQSNCSDTDDTSSHQTTARVDLDNSILAACGKAAARGLSYLWVGSACIEKTSSLELQEAVSFSIRLLRAAAVCFVHLHDLPAGSGYLAKAWGCCRYWRRSWTLQELIAPSEVEFFDADWEHRGSRSSPELLAILPAITGIDKSILLDSSALSRVAIGVRLSWAAGRESTRAEDAAYSLAGIARVNMSIRYGEGADQAFARLVNKIVQDTTDGSIFAWTSNDGQAVRGLLPRSAAEFRHLTNSPGADCHEPWTFDGSIQLSSRGLVLDSRASMQDSSLVFEIGRTAGKSMGVRLRMLGDQFVRVDPSSLSDVPRTANRCRIMVARDVDAETLRSIRNRTPRSPLRPPGQTWHIPRHIPYLSLVSVKRERSGRPKTPVSEYSAIQVESLRTTSPILPCEDDHGSCSDYEEFSDFEIVDSDDEDEDLDENDDEDEEDEGEEEPLGQDEVRGTTSLNPYHPFQSEREGLVRRYHGSILEWSKSAEYVAPPDRTSVPRKRLKTAASSPSPSPAGEMVLEGVQPSGKETRVGSRIDGYFHLACPFNKTNTSRYKDCLLEDDLRSIEDVVSHLRRRHPKPPYCPKCRIILETPTARDAHIRNLACQVRHPTAIEGVDETRLVELMRRRRKGLGEAETWRQICAVACPGASMPDSPYLEGGLGLAVSQVWDYWREKGRACIEEYMSERFAGEQFEAGELDCFHSVTLADLVRRTVEDGVS
ncbi:Vegetative incompatibility protein HET-E-1 [Colletotrichum higginsianum]|uniref:Vegetative incompatibility protein HET-E-1 n=1 Tax=Colletotrichum higginsianum TaxID=80884 RepID=A0A4T0WF64_9PEZI|nr:Vegetative incompatibility protein HET-E-1 [Colletotrichum higginsianum]